MWPSCRMLEPWPCFQINTLRPEHCVVDMEIVWLILTPMKELPVYLLLPVRCNHCGVCDVSSVNHIVHMVISKVVQASWTKIADIMYENCALFADWPKSRQYVSSNKLHLIRQWFFPAQEKHLPPTRHAQSRRDAVLNPKYLFSFAFLSGTDDPFQHGGKRGTRHEETGDSRREDVWRKGEEGRRTSSAWCMPENPCMHTNTQLSGLERLAAGTESESDPGWSNDLDCESGVWILMLRLTHWIWVNHPVLGTTAQHPSGDNKYWRHLFLSCWYCCISQGL